MVYLNKPNYALSEHERAVLRAGYHWVSVTHLNPFTTEPQPQGFPCGLNPHQHSSHNTHIIVQGSITLRTTQPPGWGNPMPAEMTLNANTDSLEDKEFVVIPGVEYIGTAGPEGCIFVEGHVALSPASAMRFESRGDVRWHEGRPTRNWQVSGPDEFFRSEAAARATRGLPRRVATMENAGLWPNVQRRGQNGRGRAGWWY